MSDVCLSILNDLRANKCLINEVAITLDENKFWRIVNQDFGGDYVKMMRDRYNCKINPKYPLIGKQGKFSLERDMMKAKHSNINKFLRDFDVRFRHADIGKRHLIPDSDGYMVDIDGDGNYDFKIDKDGKYSGDVSDVSFIITEELLQKCLDAIDKEGLKTGGVTIKYDERPYVNSDMSFYTLRGFKADTYEMVCRIFKEVFGKGIRSADKGTIVIHKSSNVDNLEDRIHGISNIHNRFKDYDDRLSKKKTKNVSDITYKLPAYNADGDVIIGADFLENILGRLGYYGLDIDDLGAKHYKSNPSRGHILIKKEDKGIKGLLDLSRKLEEILGSECVEYDKMGFIKVAKLVRSRKKAIGFVKR